MTDSSNKPHISFWLVAVLALIWNLMGVINFFGQMSPKMVASMAESHQAIINGRPIWGTISFALAVFGGAIGCILLMMRKAAALYLFVASLLGVMIHLIPNFNLAGKVQFSAGELLMMMVMPLVVAAFLAWYASQSQNKGWIK